jgi:hypothetical protein
MDVANDLRDLREWMNQGLTDYARLAPVEVLLGVVLICLVLHLISRSRDSLLVAATAALYAIPFVVASFRHRH